MCERHTIKYGMATLIYRNSADYGTWKAVRNYLIKYRVSCDPKNLTGKGDLMVVKVFSVMEKAWRRGSSRIC
jgi:hypothetical protein